MKLKKYMEFQQMLKKDIVKIYSRKVDGLPYTFYNSQTRLKNYSQKYGKNVNYLLALLYHHLPIYDDVYGKVILTDKNLNTDTSFFNFRTGHLYIHSKDKDYYLYKNTLLKKEIIDNIKRNPRPYLTYSQKNLRGRVKNILCDIYKEGILLRDIKKVFNETFYKNLPAQHLIQYNYT
tara:strand:- start:3451 stop:3981 length:531 start_codon:yes stop_codon:yes gene_type:complete